MKRSIFSTIIFIIITLVLSHNSFADPVYPPYNRITSITPAHGTTGLSLAFNVEIVFDRIIDSNTITNNMNRIQLCKNGSNCKNADTITYNTTTQKAVASFSGLSNSTEYDVFLSRRINFWSTLANDWRSLTDGTDWDNQHKFTTISDAVPPTALLINPASGATGIARTTTISATFSEEMDTSTLTSANFYIDNGVTPAAVNGITYDTTTKTVTFTPSSLLNYNTLYTATITTGVKSTVGAGGLNMAANKVWSFRTLLPDTTRPTVTSISPADGATDVPVASTITATFSEAMTPSSITAAGAFTLNNGITGTVSYNPVSWVATFTPNVATPFLLNTLYTATITTAVTDEAGNQMLANKVWSFRTTGNFTVNNVPLNNYCQIPPFVTSGANALKPNVLLIVDNSGSMYEFAYKTPGKGGDTSNYDESYNSNTNYYGYFDSTKMYSYETSNGHFYVDGAKVLDKTSFWSGNLLNWLTMRRVDVVRKVLVGGKTQPRSASVANYLLVSDDPDRDYYKKYNGVYYKIKDDLRVCTGSGCGTAASSYNMKVYVGDQMPQEGLLLKMQDRINFGIMNFNEGYRFEDGYNSVRDGGQVTVDLGATGTNLITQVENTDPSTWTPLAETLYEAIRYFQATDSAYNGGTYSGKDPITANCMKNFVMILTDGESTKDRNLPGTKWTGTDAVSSPYGFNVKTFMDRIATNEGATSKWDVNLNSSTGTWYLPGVALYSHTKDLRSATVGKSNLPGTQNLTIYSVFAFDDSADGKNLLKLTSKYGGFENSAMTETSVPSSAAQWDANNDGIPDTYFEASSGDALKSELEKAFNDILSKVSSGTSASIVNNRGESGANLFQAVFYPKKSIGGRDLNWMGELQNMWYYLDPYLGTSSIREDTNNDKKLDLRLDYKVNVDYDTTKNQTIANWYEDTTGNGTFTLVGTGSPDNIHALWKAGALLHYRDPATRKIYTTLGSYNSGYLSNTVPLASGATSGLTLFDTTHGTDIVSLDYAKANIPSASTSANNLLNVDALTTANKVIEYIRGVDYLSDPLYRSRTVTITYPNTAATPLNTTITDKTWKLGDIVSSTPQAQTSKQLQAYDSSYKDNSYSLFYGSLGYSSNNMVYTGANDGMLHAFRVGQVSKTNYNAAVPNRIAEIKNLDNTLNIGDEEWAFIPQNALPYLKYLPDPTYNHLFYVNNTVALLDVSINKTALDTTCTQAEYWKCNKKTTYSNTTTKTLNIDETSWRTVLIGGMGFGGSSRDKNGYCNKSDGTTPTSSAQETRLDCVKSPIPGSGLSSFFALDVTSPQTPKFMWEFSDAILPDADKGLGYTTSGPAIVRISTKNPLADNYGSADTTKNGRWFAVFATGPSGPIDTSSHQFMGRSDNELKVYVVDIHPDMSGGWVKGTNYWVLPSGIANAFASDLTDSVIDVDRWNSSSTSYYSDDAVYIGYTRPKASTNPVEWADGGVLRLLTNDSLNPSDWSLSTMIDGVGPVTSSPTKLQDRKSGKTWVFFGTGRYFYKTSSGTDDPDNQRYIMGIMDTCYDGVANTMNAGYKKVSNVWTKQGCGVTAAATLGLSDLQNQSSTIISTLPSAKKGWYIALDPSGDYALGAQMTTSAYKAERVVTNTTAAFNGVVFFTSFLPTDDICGYGGSTLVWAVDYLNGGTPPASTMKGKLLVQLSGGEFVAIDLATAFKANGDSTQQTHGDRRMKASLAGHGIAGSRGGSLQSASQPIRKILHIMEK
ncbi:MAG: pilus assembly protein PilY [Geobacteraceae bacterium]|nr:pilus assembly protein PilY [Geobacteraceae bacterium]NTW79016.1 pilus assembly protein PilY [Geobacteraceae bacterium]